MMNHEVTRELMILAYKAEKIAAKANPRSTVRHKHMGQCGAYFHAASLVSGMDMLDLLAKFPKNVLVEEGAI